MGVSAMRQVRRRRFRETWSRIARSLCLQLALIGSTSSLRVEAYPPEARRDPIASGKAQGFRRRLNTPDELKSDPYRFIGRVTCEKVKDANWGTGTYIGSRCVLTAAHVIQEAWKYEDNGKGAKIFILPDGRSSEIVAATIDAGWATHGYVTFDIGICRLKDDLGEGAAWGPFDDSVFDQTVELAGYDANFAAAKKKPVLVTRAAAVRPVSLNDTMLKQPHGSDMWLLVPGGQVPAAEFVLFSNRVYNSWGWSTDDMRVTVGASGAPIWLPTKAGAKVIGVTSHGTSTGNPGNVGARIQGGTTDQMIQRFIEGKSPKVTD